MILTFDWIKADNWRVRWTANQGVCFCFKQNKRERQTEGRGRRCINKKERERQKEAHYVIHSIRV